MLAGHETTAKTVCAFGVAIHPRSDHFIRWHICFGN